MVLLPKAHGEFPWKRYALFKQRFSKASAIPSGDGLGEETRRIAVIKQQLHLWFAATESNWICPGFSRLCFSMLLPALYHSNDALPSPYQLTLVGHYFCCPALS